MRYLGTFLSLLALAALGWLTLWLFNLDDVIRESIAAGHLLDWIMGGLCLVWLVVILKLPWDLYFQAQAVTFELQRSRERGVTAIPGREEYVRQVRTRLGWVAVGAHLASAALVAAVTYFTGGAVGYYFAAFYLISTLFRPTVAGYFYLSGKLDAIAEEARYPRHDIVEVRDRLRTQEEGLKGLSEEIERLGKALVHEAAAREAETRELRQNLHAVGREFETTVSRLTDNPEIIRGIQAFVRLVAQSANS